jgi:hypothetical protein
LFPGSERTVLEIGDSNYNKLQKSFFDGGLRIEAFLNSKKDVLTKQLHSVKDLPKNGYLVLPPDCTAAGKVVRLNHEMTSMAQVVLTDRPARIFFLDRQREHVATHTFSTVKQATNRETVPIPAVALEGYAIVTGPKYEMADIPKKFFGSRFSPAELKRRFHLFKTIGLVPRAVFNRNRRRPATMRDVDEGTVIPKNGYVFLSPPREGSEKAGSDKDITFVAALQTATDIVINKASGAVGDAAGRFVDQYIVGDGITETASVVIGNDVKFEPLQRPVFGPVIAGTVQDQRENTIVTQIPQLQPDVYEASQRLGNAVSSVKYIGEQFVHSILGTIQIDQGLLHQVVHLAGTSVHGMTGLALVGGVLTIPIGTIPGAVVSVIAGMVVKIAMKKAWSLWTARGA